VNLIAAFRIFAHAPENRPSSRGTGYWGIVDWIGLAQDPSTMLAAQNIPIVVYTVSPDDKQISARTCRGY
jgi:hypothetical protein